MKPKLFQVCLVLFILCLGTTDVIAQTQNPTSTRTDIGYKAQVQFLVASNLVNAKTDYPSSLDGVVKQLKSSLSFKNHYLVSTYIYNVADGSALEVNDVTYTPLEKGGGLSPTFFNVVISGIKLNSTSDSVHISKFRIDMRKRIFVRNVPEEGGTGTKSLSDMVGTGITTELNVSEGVPTIVGTLSTSLSDGVLVVVITVNRSMAR